MENNKIISLAPRKNGERSKKINYIVLEFLL